MVTTLCFSVTMVTTLCLPVNMVTTPCLSVTMVTTLLFQEAEEQEGTLKEIAVEKAEYQRLEGEINKLQKQLRDSQQVIFT